jgi:hypothetical protein
MDSPFDELRWESSSPSEEEVHPCVNKKGKQGIEVARILQTFDYLRSHAWTAVREQFSSGIRHRELWSVAIVISERGSAQKIPRPPRNAERSYPVLIKWFQDHWDTVGSVLPLVGLRDDDDKPINRRRELLERKTSSPPKEGD